MVARTVAGDIVVRQETRKQTCIYILRIDPGEDQLCFWTRDEAVAQAVAFAKRQHARAWFADRDHLVLLGSFRLAPETPAKRAS
ncbi:MAG: hypothetical protein LAO77_24585 [Acidobacteriia bacterium]|nr:hypothetical protein [Terriglobia bacterium]